MALRTYKQDTDYIIGSAAAGSTLTTSYGDNQVSFPTEMYNGMRLYVSYTPGADNRTATLQVEFGPDSSSFFPDTTEQDQSSGEVKLLTWRAQIIGATNGTEEVRSYRVPVDSSFVRISIKEDGSADFGTVSVRGEFKI